jgi:putative ABC transport system permease protein
VSFADHLKLAMGALNSHRLRTLLMLLAMAIGVASVILLTALGEGARRYVTNEFSSLGTNLLIVFPGRNETTGAAPPVMGETPRDLTLDDAMALSRNRNVHRVAPINLGSVPISYKNREREAVVIGSTSELKTVRNMEMAQGRFLPVMEAERAAPVCIIGSTLRQELFGNSNVLGEWLRIGDRRFRIIGVLSSKGVSIGMDIDEVVVAPVGSVQQLFNTASLLRILVEARSRESIPQVEQFIIKTLKQRHEGEEDVTVITQDAVLQTFDRIFTALTLTVGGIAAISMLVAGILIMNIMLVAVTQRTAEIGLLKAIGASTVQIQRQFLTEAALLSLFGAFIGLVIGLASNWLLGWLYPAFPLATPAWAIITAMTIALLTGLGFGTFPARRAARLDPVMALSRR